MKCPTEAITFVENMGPGKPQDEAFSLFIKTWAKHDVEGALTYVSGIPDQERSDYGVESLCTGWAISDPNAAENYLQRSLGDRRYFSMAVVIAYRRMMDAGPEATVEWARSLPGQAANNTTRSAILQWGRLDRASAAAYLEKSSSSDQMATCPEYVREWANRDPVEAGRWVAANQGMEVQGEMIASVMQCWMPRSPIEASKWLSSLPPGEARDRGIIVLVRSEMGAGAMNVFPWLDELANPKLKDEMIKTFFGLLEGQRFELNM